ncbi:GNAT family N-acetyltransferase [Arthrobacter sp. GCM10027362]|uniref:GNAT family N-acetyltransferase n=1 Tax=Arthrobacter sp. GCM10027362 TaxID=3273379 RepID=UPI0036386DDF
MLSRAVPWLTSASQRGTVPEARSGTSIRALTEADTEELWSLVRTDPVANVFLAAHLESARTAGPTPSGARILGCFDGGGTLAGACWAGVNVVPVGLDAVQGARMGDFLAAANRHISSIFGPAEGVLGIWSTLQHSSARPFDVRPDQPLMELRGAPAVAPDPSLRFSTLEDLDALVPACVAMFEEEVGYSPLSGGGQHYRQRVKSLIERGHSVLCRNADGEVVFKAELGNVSTEAVQIQGVWMNPAYRGQGRAAAYMAAVVELSRRYAPVASLYVNDYNHRAMAAYRRVGFEQVGTFATILF